MSEKTNNIIELQNIVVSFDGERVLDDFSLSIKDSEFVTLLGSSGCGKTTTLRLIAGFLQPDSGNVLFDGVKVNGVAPYKRPVNTIFQRYALFPHYNVYDNIAFGLRVKKVPEKEIKQQVKDMLRLVNLEGFEKRDVTRLSGGQQQRVAIARAVINKPKVLLLDEPLAALDLKLRKDMQNELKNIQKQLGITFDSYKGESFYYDKVPAVVETLREKGLLKIDDGASIVDLEPYGMPPCLILKNDGSSIYPSRDIAAAIYRKETYDFDKCIYVTSAGQSLHFAQWFKVVELMGYDWYDKLVHVPYGTVSIDGAKLATRTGNVVLLKDLFATAIEKARAIIEEKNPTLENKDEVAKQVGVGAIVFHYLSNGRIKDINAHRMDRTRTQIHSLTYKQIDNYGRK